MFEGICAFLLRLYPAGFRREYGHDAWLLISDRARHERSAFQRLRLLMDLVSDLLHTSITWQPAPAVLAQADGDMQFDFIEAYRPRPAALVAGMLTSILFFAGFILLFQPKTYPSAPAQLGDGSSADQAGPAGSGDSSQKVSGDPVTSRALIAAIAGHLKQHYVDPAIGVQIGDALLANERNGTYASLSGRELAGRITIDIYQKSRTLGILPGLFVADVVYSERTLPTGPPPPMTAMNDGNRAPMSERECLVQAIETLPHNIGYLKLNGFANASGCQVTIGKVMASLNNADALIVDLRDNGGGFGETALQIAGYLFERPAFLYDPRPNSPVPSHTSSPIPGNKLADKPVYVLTSPRTQSAAEYFAYNLKMLKRVTTVGEKTAGHQHSGEFRRVTEHYGMGVQETTPPNNPYPVKGWEVIGVEPDVTVSSGEALAAVTKLAESMASKQRY